MEIIRSEQYLYQLDNILYYIAKENFGSMKRVLKKFDKSIDNLDYMPYKFRKSFYYDDENVRDLIVKGYTIPYQIDKKSDKIVILDIFKWEDR